MTVSVSVALCTFNGGRYIEEQLRSILNQDPPPRQIVVSDDGSSDNTVTKVTAELKKAEAMGINSLLLDGPREGITANFARAISACTGDIVMLSDQDDVWHDGRLAGSIAAFARRPELLLELSDARLVDEGGAPLGMTLFEALRVRRTDRNAINRGDAFAMLLRRNIATGATVAFRRELFDFAAPLPSEWLHDEWLAIIAAASGAVAASPSQRIDYRQHDANQVGVHRPTLRYRIGRLVDSGPGRNRGLEQRAIVLRDHLRKMSVSTEVLDRVDSKINVEQLRASMHPRRLMRLRKICRLLLSGDYARYTSQGAMEAVRDLVRPGIGSN